MLDKQNIRPNSNPSLYKVVVNHEEQYSIWPAHRENPLGYRDAGREGSRDELQAYIRENFPGARFVDLPEDVKDALREPGLDNPFKG